MIMPSRPRSQSITPAPDFYPFYSIGSVNGTCDWGLSSYIPGFTRNDFGGNAQYGHLLPLQYLAFGGPRRDCYLAEQLPAGSQERSVRGRMAATLV
jgi:hypothetical protein